MAFVKRRIDVTFQLGQGSFGEYGETEVKLSGLRVHAQIVRAGGNALGTAHLQIFGMTLSKINQLSTLGVRPTVQRKNNVLVEVGNEGDSALATVFYGTIYNAYGQFDAAPNVPFVVEAQVGVFDAVYPASPLSYRGSVEVSTILSSLASKMGVAFQNFGVSGVLLSNPYFCGSYRNQALGAALATGINIDINNGIMKIWPSNGYSDDVSVLVAKGHGLIGYPGFTSQGIMFRMEFNPNLGFGSKITMRSDLTPANGVKSVTYLAHTLDASVPNGKWESTVEAWAPESAGDAVVR